MYGATHEAKICSTVEPVGNHKNFDQLLNNISQSKLADFPAVFF